MTIPKLDKLSDVHQLHDLTAGELKEVFADNESLSLITVAEALDYTPQEVGVQLRQPDICIDWYEVLIRLVGEHQITRMTRTGLADRQRLTHTLTALRARMSEVREIIARDSDPRLVERVEGRVAGLLRKAHPEEYRELIDKYAADSRAYADQQPTQGALRLLGLSDETFRDVVAADVRDAVDGLPVDTDELGHYTVIRRWRDALIELGDIAFDALEIPARTVNEPLLRFDVPDQYLPVKPSPEQVPVLARRLTFLTHLRIRLVENSRIRREQNQRIAAEVFRPAEADMKRRYSKEYAEYLRTAQGAAPTKGSNRPERPAKFPEYESALTAIGATAHITVQDVQAWLNAERDGFRICVPYRVQSVGAGPKRWKCKGYFIGRCGGKWFRVLDFDTMVALLRNPPSPFTLHKLGPGAQPVYNPKQLALLKDFADTSGRRV